MKLVKWLDKNLELLILAIMLAVMKKQGKGQRMT